MEEFALSVLKLIGYFLVLAYLGKLLIDKLEKSLSSAVERLPFQRLRRVGSAEFDPPAQVAAEVEPPAIERAAAYPALDPDSIPGRYEASNQAWLATVPAVDRERQLSGALLQWQCAWYFEATSFTILGSQFALVSDANVSMVTVERAREYYQEAALAHPDYYRTYTFEQWLGWLTETARALKQEGANMIITDDGRAFLQYIIGRGHNFARWG